MTAVILSLAILLPGSRMPSQIRSYTYASTAGVRILCSADMDADLDKPALSGYARRLTGAKLHIEDASGDFISVTAARPDTAFARDVIPGGGSSLVQLSNGDIMPGSESVPWGSGCRNPESS